MQTHPDPPEGGFSAAALRGLLSAVGLPLRREGKKPTVWSQTSLAGLREWDDQTFE